MSLAILYQEAFKTAVRIQSGKLKEQSALQLQEMFLNLFGSIQDDAKHGRISPTRDQVDDAEFAIAAFADETALLSNDPNISDYWTSAKGSLTQQLFNQANAGNEFYRRLERVGRQKTRNAGEVLEVYGLCLVLGYRGAKKGDELKAVTMDVLQQVEHLLGKTLLLSVGDTNLEEALQPPYDAWSRKLWRTAGILAATTALVYMGFLTHLAMRSDQVIQSAGSGVVRQP